MNSMLLRPVSPKRWKAVEESFNEKTMPDCFCSTSWMYLVSTVFAFLLVKLKAIVYILFRT